MRPHTRTDTRVQIDRGIQIDGWGGSIIGKAERGREKAGWERESKADRQKVVASTGTGG